MGIFSPSLPDRRVVEEVAESMTSADLAEQLEQAHANLQLMAESLADVELALDDRGWRLLTMRTEQQFTREGLRTAAQLARTMAVVNPLIRRGLALRTAYVWGGGVQISARANGQNTENPNEQDVNAVVQKWLDDKATRKALTSAVARETNERQLGTDGVFALVLFTKPMTGAVRPVHVPVDEITERISNPEDASETWYWKRQWTEISIGPDGVRSSESRTTYYPDVDYQPRGIRLPRIGGAPVMWDAPMAVLCVNGLPEWDFGIGDAFAALPWARGYKEFLEDWARLVKALSRFAWRTTSTSKRKAERSAAGAREAVAAQTADGRTPVGGIATLGLGQTLEAIPKSGATIDAESGKPLAGMVAAALDVPVTMLLTDPGSTGARAVAETLDKPTENMARQRRDVWADYYRQVLDYVIDQAVKAPRGPLQGVATRDEWDREVVELAGGTVRTLEFIWPDLTEVPIKDLVEAVAKADDTGRLPGAIVMQLLLQALGVKDVDEILARFTDEDGNWIDPAAGAGTDGDDAAQRARAAGPADET